MAKSLTSRQIKSLIKQTIATYRSLWTSNPTCEVYAARYNVLSQLLVDIEALEQKS